MNDKNIFELDPAKVATFKAERLLKAGRQSGGGGGGGARKGDTNVWPRDEFMDAWSASLPDGCEAELPFLGGIALVHEGKSALPQHPRRATFVAMASAPWPAPRAQARVPQTPWPPPPCSAPRR